MIFLLSFAALASTFDLWAFVSRGSWGHALLPQLAWTAYALGAAATGVGLARLLRARSEDQPNRDQPNWGWAVFVAGAFSMASWSVALGRPALGMPTAWLHWLVATIGMPVAFAMTHWLFANNALDRAAHADDGAVGQVWLAAVAVVSGMLAFRIELAAMGTALLLVAAVIAPCGVRSPACRSRAMRGALAVSMAMIVGWGGLAFFTRLPPTALLAGGGGLANTGDWTTTAIVGYPLHMVQVQTSAHAAEFLPLHKGLWAFVGNFLLAAGTTYWWATAVRWVPGWRWVLPTAALGFWAIVQGCELLSIYLD